MSERILEDAHVTLFDCVYMFAPWLDLNELLVGVIGFTGVRFAHTFRGLSKGEP